MVKSAMQNKDQYPPKIEFPSGFGDGSVKLAVCDNALAGLAQAVESHRLGLEQQWELIGALMVVISSCSGESWREKLATIIMAAEAAENEYGVINTRVCKGIGALEELHKTK